MFPKSSIVDSEGRIVEFQYTDGLDSAINPTSSDIEFSTIEYPQGVYVIPVTAGTLKVQLIGQANTNRTYTFSSVEVDAYQGRPFEGRICKIFATGSTVTAAKVVW